MIPRGPVKPLARNASPPGATPTECEKDGQVLFFLVNNRQQCQLLADLHLMWWFKSCHGGTKDSHGER